MRDNGDGDDSMSFRFMYDLFACIVSFRSLSLFPSRLLTILLFKVYHTADLLLVSSATNIPAADSALESIHFPGLISQSCIHPPHQLAVRDDPQVHDISFSAKQSPSFRGLNLSVDTIYSLKPRAVIGTVGRLW